MASSLIRINEATSTELQQLKGIGPRRAQLIEDFRRSVSPIRNTMDLCAATGLGIKSAEALIDQIDWDSGDHPEVNTGPLVLTTVISICLIYAGFDQITQTPFVAPASIFNFSLALILLGGLAATGDIIMAAVRKMPGESTWIFPLSMVMFASGFLGISIMAISAQFISLPPALTSALGTSVRLVIFAIVMIWMFYGPAICLRLCIHDLTRLAQLGLVYEFSLTVILVACSIVLVFGNATSLWIEEIFSLWCLVIALIGGAEMIRGRSAFTQIMSHADQSRYRFAMARSSRMRPPDDLNDGYTGRRLIAACGVFASSAVVAGILLLTGLSQ